VAGIEAFLKMGGGRRDVENLSDRELLGKASRETLVVINLVCHVSRSHFPSLAATKTTETATLLGAIVAAFRAATDGLEQFQHPGPIVPTASESSF
jgi:hypothetical protein